MSTTLKLGGGKWATKAGSLLSYNDENNNFKPLPFTFTRASTATRVNESGLIESVASGVPRIDFLDNADGHLLLEPSRTNLITYSEDFSNAAWTKTVCTITANQIVSPSGSFDADLVTTSNTTDTLQQSISATSGTAYTFSAFIKSGSADEIFLVAFGSIPTSLGAYNLTNGTATSGTGSPAISIQDYGNGWYRATLTATATSTGTANFYFASGSSDAVSTYYAWGAQVEAGSYATSYIPTSGSSVTRAAEDADNSSLMVDYSSSYTLFINLKVNSITQYSQLQFRQDTPSISYILRIGNTINIGSGAYTANNTLGVNKFALSVTSAGAFSLYKNGSLVTSGTGLNADLQKVLNDSAGYDLYEMKLYNTALSNSELAALTSL